MTPPTPHPAAASSAGPAIDLLDLSELAAFEAAVRILAQVTDELVERTQRFNNEEVAQPSLLPGWTRAHVLTHVARNADSFVNLVHWATTSQETPMYASAQERDADIQAGAGRSAGVLEADVDASAERLLAAISGMSEPARSARVRTSRGDDIPAHHIVWFRIREVGYHLVDLDDGFTFADLPSAVIDAGLRESVAKFAGRESVPAVELQATDTGWSGAFGAGQPVGVAGPAADLLGWLTGRVDGAGLVVATGQLPRLPAWG